MSGKATEARWKSLERWSPTLFLGGGVMWLVAATINSLIHFVDVLSTDTDVVGQVFISSAMLFAMIGLVGFYPNLADRRPRGAKVSLGIAVLAAFGAFTMVIWSLLSVLISAVNVLEAESPALAIIVITGLLLLITPLVFGSLVLRTDAFPRSVGGFLLAEATLMAFVVFGPTEALPRGVFLVGAEILHATIFLSIGHILRTRSASTTRAEPSPA